MSRRVFSAIIRWKPMPTPSMTARRIAPAKCQFSRAFPEGEMGNEQPIAPFRTALAPPRTANEPPVKKPAMMAFQGSSFFRMPFTAQSNVLNRPPHTW